MFKPEPVNMGPRWDLVRDEEGRVLPRPRRLRAWTGGSPPVSQMSEADLVSAYQRIVDAFTPLTSPIISGIDQQAGTMEVNTPLLPEQPEEAPMIYDDVGCCNDPACQVCHPEEDLSFYGPATFRMPDLPFITAVVEVPGAAAYEVPE